MRAYEALAVAAICFPWIPLNHDLELTLYRNGGAADIVLIYMVVFVAFYSAGAGNITWMSSEFYTLEVRVVGTMLLTMSCWGSNVILPSTFLPQMANTTPSGTFEFYVAVFFFGWVGVIYCYPDVKGMTPEDVPEIFQHGFGVQYAHELQREAKRTRDTTARENVRVTDRVWFGRVGCWG